MAAWQYTFPGEQQPQVKTDQGYAVNLPNNPRRYSANEGNATGYLEAQDGGRLYLWVHDIAMNFQIAGSYAQSHRFREWYPRNFVQPHIQIQGQVANEADYGNLCEFVRRTQRKALRWQASDGGMWSTQLVIFEGGQGQHSHSGHTLNGHILRIERTAERFVNAPQFAFEFVVVTASAGLYETKTSDPSTVKDAIAKLGMAEQVRNTIRSGASVDWIFDPDAAPAGTSGSDAAKYTKGSGRPD